MSSELVDTTEMYLRTLYELLEEGVELRRARIVERLHQSGPTVSQTVARMERDGLVVVESDRSISLTQEGHDAAEAVMRKHRLAECLLTEVIGLRPDLVHDEACRWEHVISGEVEKRLTEILDSPDVSPYGCPLPPERIGRRPDDSARFHDDSKPLDEIIAEAGCPVSVTITRLSEFFQATEGNLTDVYAAGLLPGMSIEVKDDADGIRLTGPDGSVVVDPEVLSGLFVVQNS